MTLGRKYGVIAAVFLAFAIPLYGIAAARLFHDLKGADRTLEAVDSLKGVSAQIHALQAERGLTHLWLNGGGEDARQRLAAQRREVDALRNDFRESLMTGSGEDPGEPRLLRMHQVSDGQLAEARALTDRRAAAADIFDSYTSLIERAINQFNIYANATVNGQAFADRIETHHTIGLAKEYAGIERAHVATWLVQRRKPDAGEKRHWTMIAARQENALERVRREFATPDVLAAAGWLTAENERKRLARLRKEIAAGAPVDARAWFEQASRYMDALHRLNLVSLDGIAGETERHTRELRVLAALLIALLAAGAAAAFHHIEFTMRGVVRPVRMLHATAVELEGDPDSTRRATLDTGDELGALARAFNRMVSTAQAARQALGASERRYSTLVEHSVMGIYQIEDGRFVYANPRFAEIFGYYEPAELTELHPISLVAPEERSRIAEQLEYDLRTPNAEARYTFTGVCAGGKRIAVVAYGTTVEQEGRLFQIGMCQDVTQHRLTEREMSLAATVFDASRHGIIVADAEKRILRVNSSFEAITGYTTADAVGRQPEELIKSGRQDRDFYAAMWKTVHKDDYWEGEIWNWRKSGEIYPEWLSIDVVRDGDGRITHYVGTFSDLTHQKELDARVRELSLYDPLTSLPNRRLILEHLEKALARARDDGTAVAVLFLDLDRFKNINDSLGHIAGDEMLRQVAGRLRGALRSGQDGREPDNIGRVGGDEFIVVLAGLADLHEAQAAAASLLQRFAEPLELQGRPFRLTLSIGISVSPHDADTVGALLRHADLALYEAKRIGRDNSCLYTPRLEVRAQSHVWIENNVSQALARGEFELHYQPQVHVGNGRTMGVEALLRWRNPERGSLSPAEFIPVLEETGLIEKVGAWVLERACRDLAGWRGRRLVDDGFRVSVNLSGRQLRDPGLGHLVIDLLARYALPADNFELELTESLAMEHIESSDETLARLSAAGIRLAIDDFGTGHSSLARLHRFGFHRLKIDQRFVRGLAHDAAAQSIVRATIALAHALGLEALAEGVETAQQFEFLRAHGCDTFQGFLASPALAPVGLEPVLARVFQSPPACLPAGAGTLNS